MIQKSQIKYRHDYCLPNYTITDIDLTFNLDASNTRVTAVSKVRRLNKKIQTELRLDGVDLTLVSLMVDNYSWHDYHIEDDVLVLTRLPNNFTLTIVNDLHPDVNTVLEGLYKSGNTLCTQCEAEGFRRITWYLDRPDVLARFTTTLIADLKRYPYLLSNGNRIESGKLDDDRHWIKWYDPFPKPCYLFALVAGDFDILRNNFITRSGRNVVLEIYVDRGNLDRASWAMTSLKNSMKWDEERFGLEYDLDVFMIVAVNLFNMGAMENKGLNIFNSKYILAKSDIATDQDYLDIEAVIGHEYFHNWTGNRVTCRDWFQLSLKEGLTVFRDQEFSSDLGSRAVNRINNVRIIRSVQFAEDDSPMSHPIRPEQVIEINNFYTTTVYEKGSEIVRMIHTLLGEENFQKGMQLYFARHDGNAVTCDDFIQAMEDASNINLVQFSRWYSQSGTPVLTVRDDYNHELMQYILHVKQTTPPTTDQCKKLPLHIPFNIELYDDKGEPIPLQHNDKPIYHVLNITEESQTFIFDKVYQKPIPSFMREFSAPIKLNYNWSDAQLTFLMHYARNDFSRWDAAQSLLATYIKLNVARYQHGQTLLFPMHVINSFRSVLLDDKSDPALRALILTLPNENEIATLFDTIDPEAIAAVRNALMRMLAIELSDWWLVIYNANQTPIYRINHDDISKRTLKNVCLIYLALSDVDPTYNLVQKQYYQSNNMTDTLAALTAAMTAQLDCRNEMLRIWDERWHHDGLVMDKWFALQATSQSPDVLTCVRKLLYHRSFDMNNPNRVRSLIGAFALSNPVAFHAKNGSGYNFLVEMLTDLNYRNPQIAARMIEPLIRLNRYDTERQCMMRSALEVLLGLEKLSSDLYEKISKALIT